MSKEVHKPTTNKGFRRIEPIVEFLGWLKIVLSPFLIGILAGVIFYSIFSTPWAIGVAIVLALIGLIIGILWANKIKKTQGTIHFISEINVAKEVTSTK